MKKGQERAITMSTRLFIATKALCAIISTTGDDDIIDSITNLAKERGIERKEFMSQMAMGYADALLKQEEK